MKNFLLIFALLATAALPLATAQPAFTGPVPGDAAREAMARAALLVMPSLWYEGFPMTLLEAFVRATPVLASRIGSLAEQRDEVIRAIDFLITGY